MKLLLIEDDVSLAEIAMRGLRTEGYQVQLATTSSSGWSMAMQKDLDLILLDLILPDEDGLSLCKRLRSSGIATPILMLTALDAISDRVQGLRSGADDYLIKPYAFDELLARIEALTRRRAQILAPFNSNPPVLKFGDLSVERETMQVVLGNRRLTLTPKEMGILILLLERPGAIISRERLLREVWRIESSPVTNVIDVYFGRLRRKIEGKGAPVIETVRGFGYRLTER